MRDLHDMTHMAPRYLDLRGISGGAEVVAARLPTEPGVYSWIRGHGINPATAAGFVEAIEAFLMQPAALFPDSTRVGLLHEVQLRTRGLMAARRRDLLAERARSEAFRRQLVSVIDRALVLQAPLYVGKANNLQDRILQHLNPTSELSTRLATAGIALRDCLLAYILVDSTIVDDDATIRAIEELLTYMAHLGSGWATLGA